MTQTVVRRGWMITGTALCALFAGATQLRAQTPVRNPGTAADSSLYLKAQQMVSSGDAVAGRALVDSLLKAAPVGTPRYAEGLYWRASLASTALDAERGYRQIVVDYPMSPRVDDALLRLGQLELTRGEREAALQHFQRLTLEHPNSPLTAKANYWTARAFFEKNDVSRACAANAEALTKTRASDVELRNQIEYQNQRCRGVSVASTAGAPGEVPAAVAETTGNTAVKAAAKPVAKAAAKPPAKPVPVKADDAVAALPAEETPASAPAAEPASEPVSEPDVAPVVTPKPAKTPKLAVPKPTPAKAAASAPKATSGNFAVQVAAYYDRPQADALAKKMTARGYPAHVDGDVAPFRVRVGNYATRAQATTALANMKAKKIDGFVTPL